MNPADWQRLESMFFGALAIAPEERDAYLDRECAGDATLRAEVAAVLDANRTSGGPARWTSDDEMDDEPASSQGTRTGTRIGAYRLGELIGRGGMGEVYRAERVDGEYRREVAIKLVPGVTGGEDLVRRLRVERQILANLRHPNIATLLEGGIAPDGQPYLVMEYVRGLPITEYAEAHGLPLEERLGLFRTVCDAVQYAHANLVVHRDLKPSNILVTDDGRVRLLDFGIAKLLEPGDAGVAANVTGDTLLFTPEHAAPEQLQRRPITTATDVYALGVLLYELLTGTRPFHAPTPLELYQAVCFSEPTRPSAVTGSGDVPPDPRRARTLARRLRGDLDHIVLMALRKEPERRYASAGHLGEDVARFLDGRPVLARPDAVGYRVRRFVGRNRLAVGLASLALASLVAGLLGTSWQASRARAEAARAAADRDRAESVSELLVDMFRITDPDATRGEVVTAREVLALGSERIVSEFADRPEPQADLLIEVGRIYEHLGLFEDADAQFGRALQLRRSMYGGDDPRVAASVLHLARLRILQDRAPEAVALAREATAVLRDNAGAPETRSWAADALLTLGDALRAAAVPAEAAEAYGEALTLLERYASPDDERVAGAYYGLAWAAHDQGQFDLAESLLTETISSYDRLGGRPDPKLATSLNDLGVLIMFRRRPAEAESLLRRAVEMRRRIYGPVHPAVAESLAGLARVLMLLERFPEAVDVATQAVAVSDSAWGSDHTESAAARWTLGFILLNTDRGERALEALEEARAVQVAQHSADDARVTATDITIAQAYASMGRVEEARDHYRATLARLGEARGRQSPYRAHILIELARLDLGTGRLDEAEANARASLELTREVLRPDHRYALWAMQVLARVHAARGELASADSLLRGVLASQRETLGDDHPETARTLVALADVETQDGQAAEAESHARAAIAVFDAHGYVGPVLSEARSILGAALAAQGRTAEAEPLLRAGVEGLRRARGALPSYVRAAEARLREQMAPRSR